MPERLPRGGWRGPRVLADGAFGVSETVLPVCVDAGQGGYPAGFLRGEIVGEIVFCLAQEGSAMVALGGVVQVLLRILIGEACRQI